MSDEAMGNEVAGLLPELAGLDDARAVDIHEVEIGRHALRALPRILQRYLQSSPSDSVAVLVDGVAKSYSGTDVCDAVVAALSAHCALRTVVLHTKEGRVHADKATLDDATSRVSGAAVLISIGSGSLVDIGKAVSARLDGLPHLVVQTALSVNGYANDQSVLLVDGVKRTTHTRWPDALLADTDVLREAPPSLNAAGFGDLLAMFTAPADWYLASMLGMGDGYSERLVSMVRAHGQRLLDTAPMLKQRDPQAIEYVARVLTLSGISMGAAGTTAPSSGAEHTISHLIEMACGRKGLTSAFHGAQVGVCTILAALVWKRIRTLLSGSDIVPQYPSRDVMEQRVHSAFDPLDESGAMSEECWRLYQQKLARWDANRGQISTLDWLAVDSAVAPLLAEPQLLVDGLQSLAAPTRFRDLDPAPDSETVRWALTNCHLMRDRFTVIDLAFLLGVWTERDVADVLDEACQLGAGL